MLLWEVQEGGVIALLRCSCCGVRAERELGTEKKVAAAGLLARG